MKKNLVEVDLSGGTVDAENDLVMFDDYPTWVAAAASCGAKVETGQVFTDTASAILNDCLVGEWNEDQGYINTAALDSLLPTINPGDSEDETVAVVVPVSPDVAAAASGGISPSANESVSFVDILNQESDGLEQFLEEAEVLDKISHKEKPVSEASGTKWSSKVTANATSHSKPGLYASGSASQIASAELSREGSAGKAIKAVEFYLNRAGANLSDARKTVIKNAVKILQAKNK